MPGPGPAATRQVATRSGNLPRSASARPGRWPETSLWHARAVASSRLESALTWARRRVWRQPVPVYHHPSYRLPLAGIEGAAGLEPRRAELVAHYLLASGALPVRALRRPERIAFSDLERVHSRAYLESLQSAAVLARIFAADVREVPVDALLAMSRLACGGTLAAARAALASRRPALNLLGGFHHAHPTHGGGLCALSDVAVAIAVLRAEGLRGPVTVIDLDAHPPDGLAACLHGDDAWIGSISGADWGPLPGIDESLLPGADDARYLGTLRGLLGRMPRHPCLCFVLAGGDVLAGDRLGALGLTLAGARQRDHAVRTALSGIPSVWLPAGGYHADAWRVLAGTGMTLLTGETTPIPAHYEPLAARFATISAGLLDARLRGDDDLDLSTADLMADLGGSGPATPRLLGYYTADGLELALEAYGLLDHLRRLGYRRFRVRLGVASAGDSAQLFGFANGREHLLIDLVLSARPIGERQVLHVEWLSLRHPRARFSPLRPALPNQEVPGLGLSRDVGTLLVRAAARLGLGGVAFRPSAYHVAYAARTWLRFVDPARQGRFEALLRDLGELPLPDATRAIAEGRVHLCGEPYRWEPDEMITWIAEGSDPSEPVVRPTLDEAIVSAERERCRFSQVR